MGVRKATYPVGVPVGRHRCLLPLMTCKIQVSENRHFDKTCVGGIYPLSMM